MGIQMWSTQAIINILQAIQTVAQTILVVSENDLRSLDYYRGLRQGFQCGLRHITNSFDLKPTAPKIWSHECLTNILSAAHAGVYVVLQARYRADTDDYHEGFKQGIEAAFWCTAESLGVRLVSLRKDARFEQAPATHIAPSYWFRQDIQNIFAAMQIIMQDTMDTSGNDPGRIEYNCGFETALRWIAQLFGIKLYVPEEFAFEETTFFWTCLNIEHNLQIVHRAIPDMVNISDQEPEKVSYWQGFKSAVECVGMSFGLIVSSEGYQLSES